MWSPKLPLTDECTDASVVDLNGFCIILENHQNYVTIFEDSIKKLPKHHLKGEGRGRGEWEYNRGDKLSSVHCTQVWSYHSEFPSYYECMVSQK
jgi:hypothetical protein